MKAATEDPNKHNRCQWLKRGLDCIFSLFGLMVLSPFLVLIAVAVKAHDGGPVMFRQQRVGYKGREFWLLKFRTMTVAPGVESGSFEAGLTHRVTGIGRWLRRTKLDELPQLWNVLKGNMSLVGPRPEVRKWVDAYPERWAAVLAVRPGITDPASIVFRNEEEILVASPDPEDTYRNTILPRKLDLYEEYVRTRTFRGDVGILLKTLWVVIFPQKPRHTHR